MIFEAFEQADRSMTRKYGGTGLGLAICSQLVKLMGGRLWLESQVGHGSTFCFTAPFSRQKARKTIVIKKPASLRALSVLVVDDNTTNRHILEEMLRSWHMRPTAVASGAEALAAMHRAHEAGHSFSLAIIDSQMPEMDGFTLAERIHRHEELAECALIMLTAAGESRPANRSRHARTMVNLTKPVKQSDLLDAIFSVLGAGSSELATSQPERRRASSKGRRGSRILLAEDNAVNQALAVAILEKQGHRVVVAHNGREALAALDRSPDAFDLILMDVQMPELGGLETTAVIREKEKATGTHIPIVALTAHALKGDRERCLEAGMDAYLSKPIQPEQLRKIVEDMVSTPDGENRRDDEDAKAGPGSRRAGLAGAGRWQCSLARETHAPVSGRFSWQVVEHQARDRLPGRESVAASCSCFQGLHRNLCGSWPSRSRRGTGKHGKA